jgi:hypothetical protein
VGGDLSPTRPRLPMTQLGIPPRTPLNSVRRAGVAVAIVGALFFAAAVWNVVREPIGRPDPPLVVNDVTQLNPIEVGRIIVPHDDRGNR